MNRVETLLNFSRLWSISLTAPGRCRWTPQDRDTRQAFGKVGRIECCCACCRHLSGLTKYREYEVTLMHNHHGRLRTVGLLAFLFAMVMLVGAIVAYSTSSPAFLFLFAGIGVASVAYSYWNSDKIALRAM